VNLDQLLGTFSVEQLQDLAAVWAPEEPPSNSKLELFRLLRDRMVDPAGTRRCLESCGRLERGIVRKLLRSPGGSQSVAVLGATSSDRPRSTDDTRAAISELGGMGLVYIEPEKRWESYGAARVCIPDDLVGPLRAVTGIDDRSWAEALGLAASLESLSDAEQTARLDAAGAKSVDDLCAADACSQRLAALPEPLRALVVAAVRERAGIVPLEDLPRLGVDLPEPDDSTVAGWRAELEANLIGTVGDVSLLDYGIALDGRVLAVFGEVVEALLSAPVDDPDDAADPVGPDFLLDLQELLSTVRESGARLKASGELTSAARNRIVAKMNRPGLPLVDSNDLLELRVACAETLRLVERSDDALLVPRSGWEWESRPYEQKAADLFGLVGFGLPAPRSKHHHDGLCAAALLKTMEPGAWRHAGSLANTALRRYVAGLDAADLRGRISDAVHEVEQYVLPPFPTIARLAEDLHDRVVVEAYAIGILDLATDGDGVVAERLSDFGATAAGVERGERAPAALIATPDFEVIILPEGDTTRLRYEVGQFAAREKFEQTYHLRITKERVEEAVVRGLSAERMIQALRGHAGGRAVPQNVESSIRGWAERVRVATVEHVYVVELSDERLLDIAAEFPELKKLIVRRVSPTALALSERPTDRRLLAELCRLGIHVR